MSWHDLLFQDTETLIHIFSVPGHMPATIMKHWHFKSQYQGMKRADHHNFGQDKAMGVLNHPVCFSPKQSAPKMKLSPDYCALWLQFAERCNLPPIPPVTAVRVSQFILKNCTFASKTRGASGNGDSIISCLIAGKASIGEIRDILEFDIFENHTVVVVDLFQDLKLG